VKLSPAIRDNALGLHYARKSDGSRIKFQRVAEKDGKELAWTDMAKSWEAQDGSLVILDDADFRAAYGERDRTAKVVMTTPASNVPPMAFKSAYWVEPVAGHGKAYGVIAHALAEQGLVAIVQFAMRQRVTMAVLRPVEGYLALCPLEWDTDMIRPDFAAPPDTSNQAEHDLARDLLEGYAGKYDHAARQDPSRAALEHVIQGKVEAGQVIPAPARPGNVGTPTDLAATLTAAVEAAKAKPAVKRATRKPRVKAA
jgi:DNA end-binding protein Ku